MKLTKWADHLLCTSLFAVMTLHASISSGATAKINLRLPLPTDHLINPQIYGLGTYMGEEHTASNTWSLRPAYFRFGGNMAEVFNWRIDAWNTGSDWYFTNFRAKTKGLVDRFLDDNNLHGVPSAVVVPSMGWVAKDGISGSFPESVYGKQTASSNGFGNGISAKTKDKLRADPNRALTPIDSQWISDWVSHLKGRFGNMRHSYIIGNEPMLWHETHRDAHPDPATYDEVLKKFIKTAAAVRQADPAAFIIGPALWGYLPMQQSAFDERGPWNQFRKFTDREQHGNKPFLQWFVESVVKEEQYRGTRLLDAIDVHFYPSNETIRTKPAHLPEVRGLRIRSVKGLWDKNYIDESWIADKIYLIPRLREIASSCRSDLKITIGEYNFGAEDDISGAIAQAEALGVFAREKLWSANFWTIPKEHSPTAESFKIYRNYDGSGASFASTFLADASPSNDEFSVFSAYDADRSIFTIAVINKSLGGSLEIDVTPPHGKSVKSRRLFELSEATGGKIIERKNTEPRLILPPLSVHMMEIRI